ncbi:MAG: hypothetical protein IPL61_26500 [Myxococcales bacterium]|nr:hypothetical protein [Myxococcales bacterium]
MGRVDLHRALDVRCVEGVAVELRHCLPAGWTVREDGDSFVVRGPLEPDAVDAVWRVARFVAYAPFVSLARTHATDDELRYELLSEGRTGLAFRVEFQLTRAATVPSV